MVTYAREQSFFFYVSYQNLDLCIKVALSPYFLTFISISDLVLGRLTFIKSGSAILTIVKTGVTCGPVLSAVLRRGNVRYRVCQ